MKISEYKNLNQFLTILFTFFKDNNIASSLETISDYDEMLNRILYCELNNIRSYPGIYGIDFTLKDRIEEGELYLIIFGNTEINQSSHLLIDLGERYLTSFFSFSWYAEKLPPYFKDFIDENGHLHQDVNPEEQDLFGYEIMTFEEFRIFLEDNREQKWVNGSKWISFF